MIIKIIRNINCTNIKASKCSDNLRKKLETSTIKLIDSNYSITILHETGKHQITIDSPLTKQEVESKL